MSKEKIPLHKLNVRERLISGEVVDMEPEETASTTLSEKGAKLELDKNIHRER